MDDARLSIREGSEADVPAVVDLLRSSLGEGSIPRTREFWNWKHENNPFGRSPFWLAELGGRLVGVRVFLRWQWSACSKVVQAVRAVDTATDPAHQGKGIFRELTMHGVNELASRGVGFVFNTPNDKSRPGYLKMGWSTVGRPSLWVAPRSLRPLGRVVAARLRQRATPGKIDLEDEPAATGAGFPSDAALDGLLGPRAVPGPRYRTPRDAAYLRWRYVACPGLRYRFASSDAGHVLVIYRTRYRSGAKETAICELLFHERARATEIASVLRRALESSSADYGVIAPPAEARVAFALALAGFIPAPRAAPVLTVRPLAKEIADGLPNPFLLRSWAPSVGDIELF